MKDWLIDRERWEGAKLKAFERAKWQCEACGRKLNSCDPVHHLNYDDYYDLNNLVCLCPHCHYLIHGKDSSYIRGRVYMALGIIFGIIAITLGALALNELRISQAILPRATMILAYIGIPLGTAFILGLARSGLKLTKETKTIRKAVKKVAMSRLKTPGAISPKDETTGLQIEEGFHCQSCGREISEQEFEELGGLCRRCRGMPLQKGFPAPPGLPKL